MTDRELLEKAAKAYFAQEVADGVCSFWWDEKEEAIVYIHGDNQDHNGNDVELLWIPLTENGDALRLAVKLQIPIGWASLDGKTDFVVAQLGGGDELWEPILPDELAATRRVIVRAAAEIGENMS